MKQVLYKHFFPALIILLIFSEGLQAQIVINEICPTNTEIILNTNGEFDDWFELHNAGSVAVNLLGYGLTDDPTKPFQFTFPSYSLGAGQKLIVFASDKTNSTVVDHWEMPVNAGTTWKYSVGSASLDTNWRNLSFNENTWSSGYGGIGFGDADDNTTIPVCASLMMRKTFYIPDTSQVAKANFMIDFDDGFVAYLNGVEIARANLGTEGYRPLWNELSGYDHEATTYRGLPLDSFYISPTKLRSAMKQGNNVLAIEVHNTPATSNDLTAIPYLFFGMRNPGITFIPKPSWWIVPPKEYFNTKFKLGRDGETLYLYNPAGVVADSKTYTKIDINQSYCRIPDGSATWCFVNAPSPGMSNNNSTCYSNYAAAPLFSKQGGYYSTTQSLILSTTTPGGVIRYTTNGNTPTIASTVYTSPISISTTKTIRAKVFATGMLPSEMVTNTYLINRSTKLSSFTITTDSANLWDWNTGIYVLGPNAQSVTPYKGANFWQDWQKPATIEYYDKNKNLVVRFDADIEIYGNYTRAKPQKSIEIKLRDAYGLGSIAYSMIPDKSYIDKVDDIILRNAGTDWNKVHFRDAFMERLMKNTNSGYLATEPAVAYLNGQYWGVYHINENHDHHFMKDNFGYDKKEIDYLKEAGTAIDIQEGSDVSFWNLYNYATTTTPTSTSYYNFIDANLDLKNYTDYFVAETFYDNGDWIGDWTNNIQMWRPNKTGGKWKYLLYDLDYGLGLKGTVTSNRLSIARNPIAFSYSSEMFDAILKNPTYKKYFINRYCDLMNTIFTSSNMNAVMKTYKDSMSYDMTAHFAKWGNSTTFWNSEISDMMAFANARAANMKNYIKSEFGLTGVVELTLQVQPNGAGRIEISTITPTTYPWTGDYFNGNPVTITAIPNPGYTFDHWRSQKVITSDNPNQSVTYNFNKDDVIKATFTGSSQTVKICVSELNYNADSAFNSGDWIELKNYATTPIDISGWRLSDGDDRHKFIFPTGTKIAANGYLVIVEDSAKFRAKFPTVTNYIGETGFNFSNAGDQVRLFNHANTLYLSFFYQELAPWPILADGKGYTCELTSNTANPNNGTSWFAGCLGGSPGKAYNTSFSVPIAVTGSTTFCTGSNTQLKSTNFPLSTYQWKKNGSNISGATDSVYNANAAGAYTVSITNNGCSSVTPALTVSTVSQQPLPTTASSARCGSGELKLGAHSTDSVFWYDAAVNGTMVGAGDTLYLPNVQQTKTYYVRTGRNCPSNFVGATATINPLAATPEIRDTSRCGPGIMILTAVDTAVIRWYNIGGGLLNTGPSFTTGLIENDTTYFLEAGSVCISPRIEVHVAVNTSPTPSTLDGARCGNGTVVVNATSAVPVYWYDSQSGGNLVGTGNSFTTPFITESDTFYVEANGGCPSARAMVLANINAVPADPVAADSTICSPGSATLFADASEQVYWYSSPTGGNVLFTGTTFVTPSIFTSTTYYASTGYTCMSNRVPVQAVISSNPSAPGSSNVSRCDSGSVVLNATSGQPVYWYDAPTGGNLISSGNLFTTPTLTSTTTFYAETGNYCRSTRTAAQAIINPVPAAPVTADVSRCGQGAVNLSASAAQPISWYTSASGGLPVATGSNFTTPSLSATETYYVENGSICASARIPVQAIVNQLPAVPVVSNTTRCGTGVVTLNATSSANINWYNSPTGGSVLGTGLTFNTPSISSTTTYYVEAFDGCYSARVPVQAIISSIPALPVTGNASRCNAGTVTLSATSPVQLNWYTVAAGGTSVGTGSTYTTPSISATTTYYVDAGSGCNSARVAVQAIVNPSPAAPVASSSSVCGSGTINLSATAAETIYWYTVATGGNPVSTGSTYTTPSISSTTTYYVENGNTCRSNRIAVQAVVNPLPANPSVTNTSRCGPGTVTINATSPATVSWFANAIGGAALGTGLTYTTPSINSTTTYYVEAFDGCYSSRIPVQAVISAIPSAPIPATASRCNAGTVTLSATSPNQINWYTVATGGTAVGTGSTYTTPSISATTTYYLDAGSGCNSPRVSVQAVINQAPASPVLTGGSNCGPGTITLTTSSAQVNWFSTATSSTVLGSGTSFATPSLSNSTSFYAEVNNGICQSARVSVQATINALPAAPAMTGSSRCDAGTVTLNASSSNTIRWFASATGGSSIGTGTSFTTPVINTTTTYYADAFDGCSSGRSTVQAVINNTPAVPVASDVSRCGTGSIIIAATSPSAIRWYSAPTGGTALYTGAMFTTPSLSTNTTYYVEAGTTCISARIPVQAIIGAITSPPAMTDGSNCGSGTVLLNASSSAQVAWFDVASGGTPIGTGSTFTTPVLNSTKTYYAEAGPFNCLSTRVPVQAIINLIPAEPTMSDESICGDGSVTLNAVSNYTVNWYDSISGGTLISTGTTFNTPVLNATTVYYAEATGICTSARSAVQAIINPLPADPIVSDVSICGAGSATLNAVSTSTVRWFESDSSIVELGNGHFYITPAVSTDMVYYVESSLGNCLSARLPVHVTINHVPAIPVTSDSMRCGDGVLSLMATSPEQIYWYDAANGGSLIDSGSVFITAYLTQSTTFYVETGDNCRSARVAVHAVVGNTLSPITVDGSNCGPGMVSLTATGYSPNDNILWYNHPGGTVIATGTTFTSPYITTSTVYYVTANSECVSAPVPVNAIIFNLPVVNLGPDTMLIQSGQTVTLDAGSGFDYYIWSNNETSQQILVSTPGSYTVVATNANGCTATDMIEIAINTMTSVNKIDGNVTRRVYPNPATDETTIEVSGLTGKTVSMKLYSLEGKMLMSEELHVSNGTLTHKLSLKDLASGMYYLEVGNIKNAERLIIVVE